MENANLINKTRPNYLNSNSYRLFEAIFKHLSELGVLESSNRLPSARLYLPMDDPGLGKLQVHGKE